MKRRMAEGLLSIAREDLAAAQTLFAAGHSRHAGYGLQQTAEKAVKAVLVVEGIDYPYTHHIAALAALLPAPHPWREVFAPLDDLTDYATVLRYREVSARTTDELSDEELVQMLRRVQGLLPDVERWCADRLAGP